MNLRPGEYRPRGATPGARIRPKLVEKPEIYKPYSGEFMENFCGRYIK